MRNRIIGLGIVLLAFIATNSNAQEKNNFEIYKNLELMELVYQNVDMYYVDDPQPGALMKTGIDAMLKSLDPYTVFYAESNIEDYRFMTTGQYGGIGSLIRKIDDHVVIAEPYENNPAHIAGLRAGDKILSVDGKDAIGISTSEVSAMLKGQKGTSIEVEVERLGEGKKKITVNRDEIKLPDVPFTGMLDEKTGYAKLNSFTKTAHAEVLKAYQNLESQGMKQFILDLRGNGGGLLMEAVKIVNIFVKKNQLVVYTKGKVAEKNHTYKTRMNAVNTDIPVVVLVDGHSASASEIVSGALQDLDRAVVIGNTTFGKGLVQQTLDLKYNAKMKVTIAKYYTPSGRCIQKLDYAHEGTEISDSLIKKFETVNGREVIDARGVEPEFKVELPMLSRLTATLLMNNFIFNYATLYHSQNEKIAKAADFKLTKTDYDKFVAYLSDKEYDYTTASQELLERLEETASKEKYLENAKSEYEALLEKLKPSKKEDLVRFQSEITELLEDEIVSRYYFQNGRAELALKSDLYVKKAIEVLNNRELYNSTLKNNVK